MITLKKKNEKKIIIHIYIYNLEELNILTNSSIEVALKVLEKCTKNLIGHSRLAFNNHESNIDC